jgi:hypothetical protein
MPQSGQKTSDNILLPESIVSPQTDPLNWQLFPVRIVWKKGGALTI